jgi:hypothetical protein
MLRHGVLYDMDLNCGYTFEMAMKLKVNPVTFIHPYVPMGNKESL